MLIQTLHRKKNVKKKILNCAICTLTKKVKCKKLQKKQQHSNQFIKSKKKIKKLIKSTVTSFKQSHITLQSLQSHNITHLDLVTQME